MRSYPPGTWVAALLAVAALIAGPTGGVYTAGVEYTFPDNAKIIDVKRDFGAKGGGRTQPVERRMR